MTHISRRMALSLITVACCAVADHGSVDAAASSPSTLLPSASSLDAKLIDTIRADASYMRLVTARAPRVAANGAVGRNITAYSDVAAQRDVIWLILRGFATNNRADVESTVHALEYAFENQTPQGNFKNAVGATAQAAVGADAFFLQAFGRVSLLIRNSVDRRAILTP